MAIVITKAKRRIRGTTVRVRPSRARDEALQQQMETGVQASFSRGIRSMQADIDPDTLAKAYMAKDYSKLMRQIPMERIREAFGQSGQDIGKAIVAGANEAAKGISLTGIKYDLRNPRIGKYIENRSGALIQNVSDQFQEFVGGLIKQRFAYASSTADLAGAMLTPAGRSKAAGFVLKYGLGLDSRSAGALAKRTESGDYTKAQLKQYESDLHVARAKRIARTEVAYAMNEGQLDVWTEAKEQGLVDENAMKVWTVDGDPCKYCIQLDGVAVPLAENFLSPQGDEVQGPPLHPSCMCVLQLQTGADDEGPVNNE